ncbi:LysM peptidoglycan-binding domain-containing protein [Streptomyces sp. PTM05]|uniref:LysM peptidoglycan-binding domain-containing protein n=1 Tax=Streptantibioticus parmotrematis TaxID=2873249 RepID=A0ABS7QWY8_9ACTN|nr:transglycosylase family protein [Streptantibioticus parmotrematis]MBY8887725.1 LysM peptidoglycan-binding domain-containing protein [Streptantibioticus parmotrematis]
MPKHRKPRQAPKFVVTVGATGAGLALPLFASGSAHAASDSTWDSVAQCETGGMWSANNGDGFYGGLQLDQSTWDRFGGTAYASRPDLASRQEQIAVAQTALDSQGPDYWAECGADVGLVQGGPAPQPVTGDPSDSAPSSSLDTGPSGSSGSTSTTTPTTGSGGTGGTAAPTGSSTPSGAASSSTSATPGPSGSSSSPSSSSSSSSSSAPTTSVSPSPSTSGKHAAPPSPGSSASSGAPNPSGAASGSASGTPGLSGSSSATTASGSTGTSGSSTTEGDRGDGGTSRDSGDGRSQLPGDGGQATGQGNTSYTVQPGDNLSEIASDHSVPGGWSSLYDANKSVVGGDPDLILPGQQLTLG